MNVLGAGLWLRRGRAGAPRSGLAPALALMMLLGACSTMEDIGDATASGLTAVADAANPFNWFGDDEEEAAAKAERERAGASARPKTGVESASRNASSQDRGGYPRLGAVPERPKQAIADRAEAKRRVVRQGLVADMRNAEYTDREFGAQTASPPAPVPIAPRPDTVRAAERVSPPKAPVAMPPSVQRSQPARDLRRAPRTVAAAIPRVSPPKAAVPEPPPVVASAARVPAPTAATAIPPRRPGALIPPRAAPAAPALPSRPVGGLERTSAPPTGAAPAAPGQQAFPSTRGALKTLQVATIYFNDGSSRLSKNDKQVIRQVAEIARRTDGRLRVIGHSSVGLPSMDATRQDAVNFKMSLRRANAVAGQLLQFGVPGDRMQVAGEGHRHPIYAESSPTGAAGNRRTEIYLEYYEGS